MQSDRADAADKEPNRHLRKSPTTLPRLRERPKSLSYNFATISALDQASEVYKTSSHSEVWLWNQRAFQIRRRLLPLAQ
jgi:hypothetical protein